MGDGVTVERADRVTVHPDSTGSVWGVGWVRRSGTLALVRDGEGARLVVYVGDDGTTWEAPVAHVACPGRPQPFLGLRAASDRALRLHVTGGRALIVVFTGDESSMTSATQDLQLARLTGDVGLGHLVGAAVALRAVPRAMRESRGASAFWADLLGCPAPPPRRYAADGSGRYTEEFRRAAVARARTRGGLTLTAVARELAISPTTLRAWIARSSADDD